MRHESDTERWKTVAKFPDYEVSNKGRVRRATPGYGTRVGRILSPRPQTQGYLTVNLSKTCQMVHRLVWEAFRHPIPAGEQINHLSYDKTDNRLENLECVTAKRNMRHAIKNGHPIGGGERHPKAKLTDAQVAEIRARYTGRYGQQTELAREYGVKPPTICLILQGASRV